MTDAPLPRRALAEFLGSAFLAATVIGSGIAAAQLSPGDTGLQLFENAAATAAGLFTFILMFGPISGAHFNPVVSLVDAALRRPAPAPRLAYVPAQVAGCVAGAVAANAMFGLSAVSISTTHRASPPHLFAEVVATLGLLLVIFSLARTRRGQLAPAAVGAYIGAAYFFTSSTSFANPAIDVGRMFSDTFAGIAPASVPAFVGRPAARRRGRARPDRGPLSRHHARGGRRDHGAAGGLVAAGLPAVPLGRRPCPHLARPLSISSSRSFVAPSAERTCRVPTPASAAATATASTSPARVTPA